MRTQKVRQSPRRIRSDPIGSAINSRTVRQKVRQKSPPMSANVRQSYLTPMSARVRRGQLSAADSCPPRTKSAKVFRKKIFIEIILGGQSSAGGQCSPRTCPPLADKCPPLADKHVSCSRTNMSTSRGQTCPPLADECPPLADKCPPLADKCLPIAD